jgi:hypothetical protein
MIRLAEIINTFVPDLEQGYGERPVPSHRHALAAIQRCRTSASGIAAAHCHDCEHADVFPLSCGHRFCPQCQHEAGEAWLARQRAKLPITRSPSPCPGRSDPGSTTISARPTIC